LDIDEKKNIIFFSAKVCPSSFNNPLPKSKKKKGNFLEKTNFFFFQRRLSLTGRTTTILHCHLLLFYPLNKYRATGRRRSADFSIFFFF